jgi:argininosuccinate lyase
MLGRKELAGVADLLLSFGAVAHSLAGRSVDILMPGYTHFQAAQIISPGFYFAALSGQILHSLRRLLATYDEIDYCPLGAGAMAGQQLGWDRDRMARLLGFRGPQPLALTSVACRAWVAETTAELGLLGITLSRFCTDLINWGGSEYGFIDLPDALSGISSAMPQKKNFTVLERIRGKTAHLTAMHLDVALGQRNTPYTSLVEVSKEASSNLMGALDSCRTAVTLFTAVLEGLTFRRDRMADACAREYFGGFSLANSLTLSEGIPWRTAQVIVGAYVAAAMETGLKPGDPDASLLRKIAVGHGYELNDPAPLLAAAFDVSDALRQTTTAGSVHPDAVRRVLAEQDADHSRLRREWSRRQEAADGGMVAADRLLRPQPPRPGNDD